MNSRLEHHLLPVYSMIESVAATSTYHPSGSSLRIKIVADIMHFQILVRALARLLDQIGVLTRNYAAGEGRILDEPCSPAGILRFADNRY